MDMPAEYEQFFRWWMTFGRRGNRDTALEAWLARAALDKMPKLIDLPEPMSPEPGETERECFEAEAEEHGHCTKREHWNPDTLTDDGPEQDGYENRETNTGWLFWRARAAITPPTSD